MNDIRAKAEEWNAGSTKKVPYEFVEFCEDKRSVKASKKYCEWDKYFYGNNCIATSCGKATTYAHGSALDAFIGEFAYCPWCGREIELIGGKRNG